MSETSNLGLPLMEVGQGGKELLYNAAMAILDDIGPPGGSHNLDASGSAPTTGDLDEGHITFRLDGDSLVVYANISGVIKSSVISTLA